MPLKLSRDVLSGVLRIAVGAGESIVDVYDRGADIRIEHKSDNSPVTEADKLAHTHIERELTNQFPGLPVLSEESESISYAERSGWNEYWLVDPLDGTREFIHRTGEFTVNIALIRGGVPVLGVVTVPLKQEAYVAARGVGAFKVGREDHWQPISTRSPQVGKFTVVASRRHGAAEVMGLIARLEMRFGEAQRANIGSSLKFCLIAEGRADFYPRLAPTSEWDTAAAQAVLEAAGGAVVDLDFNPLRYNRKESLLNPYFLALGKTDIDWQAALSE